MIGSFWEGSFAVRRTWQRLRFATKPAKRLQARSSVRQSLDNRLTISRWWPRVLDGCLQTPALDSLTASCCQIPKYVACLLLVTRCIAGDYVRTAIRKVGSFCASSMQPAGFRGTAGVAHVQRVVCHGTRSPEDPSRVWLDDGQVQLQGQGQIDRSCMSCMGSATTCQCRARHNLLYGTVAFTRKASAGLEAFSSTDTRFSSH